jgi:hypothetical protein
MHVVNFRYKNGSGQWSSVVSDFFYKHGGAGNQNSITSYDYWFDDDFASKINVETANESTAEILVPVNAASLSTGLHKVHFRFNSGNLKSIVTSDYFYKIGSAGLTENMVTGYRFLFDGNQATMREISLPQPVSGLVMLNDIELPYLPLGKHLLSVDFKDSIGHYSSVASDSIDVTNCMPYSAGTISGLSAVCKGTNGVVYSIPAISNATGYAWSVPEGITIVSGATTRSIVVNITEDAQSGFISVSGVNPCGSGNSNAIALTVTPTPTPSITGDTVVCSGSSAVIYATEPGYANYAWNVTPGGHVVAGWGTNSITVNWISQGGNQKVTVRYHNNTNCQGVKTVDVTVLPLPASNQTIAGSVVPGGGTLCGDATNTLSVPEPGSSFEVESGGSAILMAGVSVKLMPGVKVYAGGYLHAYLTSDCFYCNAVPHNLPQVPAKSLITEEADEPAVESRGDLQFSVFPNPTTGIFTLEMKGADQSSLKRVAIYNLHGSKIREGVIAPELSVSTWNLEGAPSGLYIIKVFTDQGSGTARVMKNE